MKNKKCGFVSCSAEAEEELIIEIVNEKSYLSSVCKYHLMQVIKLRANDVIAMFENGTIYGEINRENK